jgi:hypothetical protein
MIYNKLVEIGRVVFIAKGKDEGKLATIVNIVDGTKVFYINHCQFHQYILCLRRFSTGRVPVSADASATSRTWS